MDWYSLKILVIEQTSLSRDALHILLGLAGQLLVAAIIRRSIAHPVPWIAVLAAELVNEYFDLTEGDVWDRPMWPGSLRDLIVTMAVPTALLLLSRIAPGLLTRSASKGRHN